MLKLKKSYALIFIVLGQFLLSLTSHASILDHLSQDRIESRIRREFTDLDIGFDVDIVNLDLTEGLGLSAKYKYEVEPSHKKGLQTRVDTYRVKFKLNPGDVINDNLELPLFFGIDRESEIAFVRQFTSKKKALTALPYSLLRFPLKAKIAKEKLVPGDFVAFPANLNIVVGAQANYSQNALGGKAKVYYVMSGKFVVHVIRMPQEKVRLKIIAENKRTTGISGEAGLDLNIFGVRLLDRAIESIFETDLVEANSSRGKGNQLVLDYIFDLNNEEAREAYNQILSSSYKFNDGKVFKEMFDKRGIANTLLSTYEKAEKLARKMVGEVKPAVVQVFKGLNKFKRKDRNLKLGLFIAKFKKGSAFVENNLTEEDATGKQTNFYHPIYTRTDYDKVRLLFMKIKEEVYKTTYGIADVNSTSFDFGYTYKRKDKYFTEIEQSENRELFLNNIPDQILENIEWGKWEEFKLKKDVGIVLKLIIKDSAFSQMRKYSEEDLLVLLTKFYKERKKLSAGLLHETAETVLGLVSLAEFVNKQRIKTMAKKLHQAFQAETNVDRLKGLMELRNKYMFKKLGIGFILSLITEDLDKHIYFTMSIKSQKAEAIDLTFGTLSPERESLHRELEYLRNVMFDRSYDWHLDI